MSFTTPTLPEPSRLDDGQVRRARLIACIGLATLVASVLYAPWSTSGPVMCPLRFLVGLPCPGCGLTRSFCALAQGDLHNALHYHLLGPGLFLAVAVGSPLLLYQAWKRRRMRWLERVLYSRFAGYAIAGMLGLYHAVRLVIEASNGELWQGIHGSLLGRMIGMILG